jgi:hypothetical protein
MELLASRTGVAPINVNGLRLICTVRALGPDSIIMSILKSSLLSTNILQLGLNDGFHL